MSEEQKQFVDFGPFTFDLSAEVLLRDRTVLDLPPKAAQILKYLIENRERLVSRDELMKQIWPSLYVDKNNVDQRIRQIRRTLGKLPDGSPYLERKSKRGWRFIANVTYRAVSPVISSEPLWSDPNVDATAIKRLWPLPAFALVLFMSLSVGALSILLSRKTQARILQYTQLTNDGHDKDGPLLTDGSGVFFAEGVGAARKIMSVPVSGGEVTPMPIPLPAVVLLDISKDGSLMLVRSSERGQNRLWIYPVRGGAPVLLGAGMVEGAWAPNGNSVAMCGENTLSIAHPGRPGAVQRTTFPGPVDSPRWSPDGTRIRLAVYDKRSELRWLWETDASGKDAHRLWTFRNRDDPVDIGAWSHDGKYYFYEVGAPSHEQLWAMPESTSLNRWRTKRPLQLTGGPGAWSWPTTSLTDSSSLFALSEASRPELVRLDIRSGSWVPEWEGAPAYELESSRDGRWIAYTRYPDHTIWKARPDGSKPFRLTDKNIEAHEPHWSPDGSRIAFMGKNKAGKWRVFCLHSNGGASEELLPKGDDQGVPTWSPDGASLIFGDLQYRKLRSKMSLHLLNLSTRKLSDVPGSSGLWSPRWSPNGEYVSAVSADSQTLCVTSWKNLNWKRMLTMHVMNHVTWSPDSRYIQFDGRTETGFSKLYRVSIPEGKLESLVDLKSFAMPDETWFGVAGDGAPLGFRSTSIKELWALKCALP